MGIKIGIPGGAGGDAPVMPAIDPASAGAEQQDVSMIDQAIEQIKAGDSQGAIATLEALKGNEQGEVEAEMPPMPEAGAEGLSPELMGKIQGRFGKK